MEYKTICFSGHRPEKLPGLGDDYSPLTSVLKSLLFKEISLSLQEGYNCFITGLARGIDNWAADIIIDFKLHGNNIKLICVMPHKNYGTNWKGFDKWNLSHILEKADEVITISESYSRFCMKERNFYMVDHSDKLIALLKNERSGTGQTVRYAKKKGLEVKLIDLNNYNFDFVNTY